MQRVESRRRLKRQPLQVQRAIKFHSNYRKSPATNLIIVTNNLTIFVDTNSHTHSYKELQLHKLPEMAIKNLKLPRTITDAHSTYIYFGGKLTGQDSQKFHGTQNGSGKSNSSNQQGHHKAGWRAGGFMPFVGGTWASTSKHHSWHKTIERAVFDALLLVLAIKAKWHSNWDARLETVINCPPLLVVRGRSEP